MKIQLHVGRKADLSFNLRHFWPMKSFRTIENFQFFTFQISMLHFLKNNKLKLIVLSNEGLETKLETNT